MIFYHGTNLETYLQILEEECLWGKRGPKVSRCTYLAAEEKEAEQYGEIILEVEYDPFINKKENNYCDGCWQLRVYEPIPIENIKTLRTTSTKYKIRNEPISKLPKLLTDKDIEKHDWLNIGELKEKIKDLPNDGKILIQRVEDFYYEENNWGVYLEKDVMWLDAINANKIILKSLMKPDDYPLLNDDNRIITGEAMLKSLKDQYTLATTLGNDGKNLFINLHI
jgi:hypothetical protein